MKKLLLIIVGFMSVSAQAAVNCFAHTTFAWNSNAGVSAPMNSTGASLLVAAISFWPGSDMMMADSQNNNWEYTSTFGEGAVYTQVYFVPEPITSASHTFGPLPTYYPSGIVWACKGTLPNYPLLLQNGKSPVNTLVFQSGSVTPAEAGDLIVAVTGTNSAAPYSASLDGGFGTPLQSPGNHGNTTASILVAPSTMPVNPTWKLGSTSNCATGCSTTIVVFRTSTAAPASVAGPPIKTFAGTGVYGGFVEDALPTASPLRWPGQVKLDPEGNVYIADIEDNRIVAVNTQSTAQTILSVRIPPGRIATVAGMGIRGFCGNDGLAARACLDHPVGLALDASGDLYIADQGNHQIRRVDHTTGIITTPAGNSRGGGCGGGADTGFSGDGGPAKSAKMDCPQGVAIGPDGNLYISDSMVNRVRAVNLHPMTQTILGVRIPSGYINTVAGTNGPGYNGDDRAAITAQLGSQPLGITLDPTGNLYICDQANQRIRRVNNAGIITTYAGTGVQGYNGEGRLATSTEINIPFDVTWYRGDIYFTDTGNQLIRKIDHMTGTVMTIAGRYGVVPPTGASGVAWRSYKGMGGGYVNGHDDGPALLALFRDPIGLAFDASGNYYIGDLGNNRVRKVIVTGTRTGRPPVERRRSRISLSREKRTDEASPLLTQRLCRTGNKVSWEVRGTDHSRF